MLHTMRGSLEDSEAAVVELPTVEVTVGGLNITCMIDKGLVTTAGRIQEKDEKLLFVSPQEVLVAILGQRFSVDGEEVEITQDTIVI